MEKDKKDKKRANKKVNLNWDKFQKQNGVAPSKLMANRKKSSGKKVKVSNKIAIDCEMVGVGENGNENALARVSLVDYDLKTVYDCYVKPKEPVINYRTAVSGIERRHLINGKDFDLVQKEVGQLIKAKIVIGHAIQNDFKVLLLKHSLSRLRDTSKFPKFRAIMTGGGTPSLRNLAAYFLNKDIQMDQHDSIEDARIAMMLYKKFEKDWESSLRPKKP